MCIGVHFGFQGQVVTVGLVRHTSWGTRQRVARRFSGRFEAWNPRICDWGTFESRYRSSLAAVGLVAYRSKASELPPGRDHWGGPAVAREISVVPRGEVDYERRARTRFSHFRARQKTRKPDSTWSVPRSAGVARRSIKLSVQPLVAVALYSRGPVGLSPCLDVDEVSSHSVATWLILPVVICLSLRLSHACLSTNS